MQPDLAVIYMSGNGVDRTRQVSRALFFDKPYDSSRVTEACQELLSEADGPPVTLWIVNYFRGRRSCAISLAVAHEAHDVLEALRS